MSEIITPEFLLNAYCNGYFPMAKSRRGKKLYWFHPEARGVIPLEQFHIPASLKKVMKTVDYTVTFSIEFEQVIRACADAPRPKEAGTWINDQIIQLYTELWKTGFAHSVEIWENKNLIGGLYGVSIGGAFFGESMFSRAPNASKMALVHLVGKLKAAGYQLLDTQYVNDHLTQFGVIAVNRADYLDMLEKALNASSNPSSRFLTASDSST